MEVRKPKRGKLIREVPIFEKVRPWERPRKGKAGNMYQPLEKQHELINEFHLYAGKNITPIEEPVIIDSYVFFRKRREESTWPVAPQFGDEDNLRKTINDCLVLVGILGDDRFVIGGEHFKQFAYEDYAVIKIYEVKESA